MEEKKLRNIKWFVAGLLIVAIIIGGIYVLGSRNMAKTAVFSNDPETGIKMWIDAANQKDINRLYDLAPDEIKQQMTLARFEESNLNSSILQPGSSIASYDVIDKKQNGTFAQINARVFLLPPGAQGNLSQRSRSAIILTFFMNTGNGRSGRIQRPVFRDGLMRLT